MKKKSKILSPKFFLYLFLSATCYLLPASLFAQFTTVTGTIVDPNGIPYGAGTVSATLVVPGGGSGATLNGAGCCAVGTALLDANGSFTMRLGDNSIILPAGTKWRFDVSESPGVFPPFGFGSVAFSSTITITGSTQDVSATLSAAAVKLSRIGTSAGTVTSVNGTVNQIGVATPTTTPTISITNPVIFPGAATVTQPAGNVVALTITGSANAGHPDIFEALLAGGGPGCKVDYLGNLYCVGTVNSGSGGSGVGCTYLYDAGGVNFVGDCAPNAISASYTTFRPTAQGAGALTNNGSGVLTWSPGGGGVASFSGDGSLLTNSASTGAVTATLGSQLQNLVFASPSGSAGVPTFRAIVPADLVAGGAFPTLNQVLDLSASKTFNNGANLLEFTSAPGYPSIQIGDVTHEGSFACNSAFTINQQCIQSEANYVGTSNLSNSTFPLSSYYSLTSNVSGHTVAEMAGLWLDSNSTSGGGSVTTQNEGILIGDQTAGSINYAIKSGLGLLHFGDRVGIGADPATGIDLDVTASAPNGGTVHIGSLTANRCVETDGSTPPKLISTAGACPGAGGGSVTDFSSGNLSPLFTTSVATPSTTPVQSFTLSSVAQNTVFAGSNGGGTVPPTFRALVTADLPAGTGTVTSVSGTANQIASTGGATPVLSITSPFQFPAAAGLGALPVTGIDFDVTSSSANGGTLMFGTGGGGYHFPNANPGTVLNESVCKDSSGNAIVCGTAVIAGVAGVAIAGAGNSGSVSLCLFRCDALFDNQTVIGHIAVVSPTVIGEFHDTGGTGEVVGNQNFLVDTLNSGAATIAKLDVMTPDQLSGGNAGNGGKGIALQVNGTATKSLVNFNGTTPVAGTNGYNLTLQSSNSGNTTSVSGEIVGDGNAAHFLNGTGAFTSPGSVTQSGGTLGYIPKFGTVPNLINSTLDENVTTASTLTATSENLTLAVPASGSVDSPSFSLTSSVSGVQKTWAMHGFGVGTSCLNGVTGELCLTFGGTKTIDFSSAGTILQGGQTSGVPSSIASDTNGNTTFTTGGWSIFKNTNQNDVEFGGNGTHGVALTSTQNANLYLCDQAAGLGGSAGTVGVWGRIASTAAACLQISTGSSEEGDMNISTLKTTDAASTLPALGNVALKVCNNGDVTVMNRLGGTHCGFPFAAGTNQGFNVSNAGGGLVNAQVSGNFTIGTSFGAAGGAFTVDGSGNLNTTGTITGAPPATITTATNCSSSASPAVCGSAAAGSFVIAASGTSVTVNTSAVTANSQIFIQEDETLGTKLSVTCNTGILANPPAISARTAATSFTVSISVGLTVNPVCFSYVIVN